MRQKNCHIGFLAGCHSCQKRHRLKVARLSQENEREETKMKTILILVCAYMLSGCAHVMRQDLLKKQSELNAVMLELQLSSGDYTQKELKQLILKQEDLRRQCENKIREIVLEEQGRTFWHVFFFGR